DLPHRSMVSSVITELFKVESAMLKKDLQGVEGRISLTTDTWSDTSLDGYMAISAHFISHNSQGVLEYRSELLSFCYVEGSHT
ncbi:hypothetical protein P691DRAFT_632971, partial [Macrolepiota fuliginosa MF-IS2]